MSDDITGWEAREKAFKESRELETNFTEKEEMGDPNLPEVAQKDIDQTVGETFNPDVDSKICKHGFSVCEVCAFHAGMIEGVRLYAWWKDGVQYVGSCGTTLTEAVERIKKEKVK